MKVGKKHGNSLQCTLKSKNHHLHHEYQWLICDLHSTIFFCFFKLYFHYIFLAFFSLVFFTDFLVGGILVHLWHMEIGFPSLDSSSLNNDEKLINKIKEENRIVVQVGIILSTLGIFSYQQNWKRTMDSRFILM